MDSMRMSGCVAVNVMKRDVLSVCVLLLASASMTDALAQTDAVYSCATSSTTKVGCGVLGDYVGVVEATAQQAGAMSAPSMTLTPKAVVQDGTIYDVKVQSAGSWCFTISGDKSKVHGFKDAPILEGRVSSVAVLAGSTQRVLTNQAGASVQVCSAPLDQSHVSHVDEFYLLSGSPQKVVYLAQSPSTWLNDPNAVMAKVADKTSSTVKRSSYFFIDLTESNASQMLNLAQQGAFPYVLIYANTWAKSLGSYPINTANYPHGMDGLLAVSKQASQLNIRLGLHTLTALVSKNDPLANSSHGLLKKNNTLVSVAGGYVVDLKDDLRHTIAGRIADVVNKLNPGMIYFDGAELSAVAGDPNYDTAEMQIDVLGRLQKQLLVQDSASVARSWPYLSRMAMDDYATLAPVEYLDAYKIAQILPMRRNSLMPAELGWIGIVAETPAHPATTVEEMSTYMARALALDLPFSIESRQADLDTNPYSFRLFRAIGAANRSLQAGNLSAAAKSELNVGRWYFVEGTHPYLAKLALTQQHIASGQGVVSLGVADKNSNGVMFRISNVHDSGDQKMMSLLPTESGISLKNNKTDPSNRGMLAASFKLGNEQGGLDLSHARSMSIDYSLQAPDSSDTTSCATLNAQLEDVNGSYRDYYLPLSAHHTTPMQLSYLDAPAQMLTGLMPSYASYRGKSAIYNFNFSKVVAINFRWMKTCSGAQGVIVKNVSMVKENTTTLNSIQLLIGNTVALSVPALKTGEVLDVFPNGAVTICQLASCKQIGNISSSMGHISNQPLNIKTQGNAAYDLDFGVLTTKVQL